ncbi:zinc metalloprotease [Faucicola boevrei]|uniref:hypothetical protein n=1 Tax=Faucicola boevrei TaxID=346665 RepID=UPI00035E6EA2|nr:hypothetical protein [Moraxella boevrei]
MVDDVKHDEVKTSIACTAETEPTKQVRISGFRRFLVHFRRHQRFYDGSFGFDWLRDEYIYDLMKIGPAENMIRRIYRGKGTDRSGENPNFQPDDVKNLINEYLRYQVIDSDGHEYKDITTIDGVPFIYSTTKSGCERYVPAWLSIFPKDYPSGSEAKIHPNGVKLYLMIEQEEIDTMIPLESKGINDVTLNFIASDGLELSVMRNQSSKKKNSIPLKNLVSEDKKRLIDFKSFDNAVLPKKVNYYENFKDAPYLNIICTKSFSKPGYVKVIATDNNGKEKVVGLLMVYPNSVIPKAEIQIVNLFTKSEVNVYSFKPNDYVQAIEKKSFCQALISCKVLPLELNVNIADMRLKYETKLKNQQINSDEIDNLNAIKVYLDKYKSRVVQVESSVLIADTVELYNKLYRKNLSKVDDADNKTTFLFVTDFSLGIGGVASGGKMICSPKCKTTFGNACMVFYDSLTSNYVHELGHSFSLHHTFLDFLTPHVFYQSYTDNVMDYASVMYSTKNNPILQKHSNEFSEITKSFFKWQWDMMRHDVSMVY